MRALIARKVARLVGVVDDMRSQVRVAGAAEWSKAVSATVRDVLAALLGGRHVASWEESDDAYGPRRPGGDDDWDDPFQAAGPYNHDDDDEFEPPRGAGPAAAVTPAAVTLAVAAGS